MQEEWLEELLAGGRKEKTPDRQRFAWSDTLGGRDFSTIPQSIEIRSRVCVSSFGASVSECDSYGPVVGFWAAENAELDGGVRTLRLEKKMKLGWAIPSPDGKHLAMWKASQNSNAWMLENF